MSGQINQFGRPIINMAGTPRMGLESARSRTLYVKVKPAPTNLSERRAVLQLLKQHGEIHMFKRLIDASSFISLAGTKSLADRIVSRSPLTFNTPEKKEFLVHIFLTEKYFHKTHIRDSPIHGKWEIDRLDVWGQHTLSKNALPPLVPTGMGYRGLVDWESCGQLEELADPEEKHLLNDKELFQVREKRRQSLAQMESLIETWKLHTEEGRKAAPMLEKAGFGVSEKTKAKAFDVLEQAAIESQKVKDYGKASF